MTAEEVWRALSAETEHGPVHESEALSIIRAALRERDAEHEIALKKARADALDAAADLCLGEPTRLPFKKVTDDHPANGNYMHYADLVVRLDALAVAIRSLKKGAQGGPAEGQKAVLSAPLRALLEEAGK